MAQWVLKAPAGAVDADADEVGGCVKVGGLHSGTGKVGWDALP